MTGAGTVAVANKKIISEVSPPPILVIIWVLTWCMFWCKVLQRYANCRTHCIHVSGWWIHKWRRLVYFSNITLLSNPCPPVFIVLIFICLFKIIFDFLSGLIANFSTPISLYDNLYTAPEVFANAFFHRPVSPLVRVGYSQLGANTSS